MTDRNSLRSVTGSRFVTPLREGGSLPGIVEGDDLGTYVCKFRGAGQGLPVLVAEVFVGELARALGLRTPELVCLEITEPMARYEADEEVQDLLNASIGLNLGVDFLPGSFGFDPGQAVDPEYAAKVIWLDAYVANVDRSWRNPNLLWWHQDLWLIDHGASLYFHHGWIGGLTDASRFVTQPWSANDHVLSDHLTGVGKAHQEMAAQVDGDLLDSVLALVPDEWLSFVQGETPGRIRKAYRDLLLTRLANPSAWLPRGDG
ncbi:MAG: hypothetical protein H6530_03060 [Nocardioidaceae bacterium]|nr:hypothetical protein [Nocardioidaceae bacterium]MCO5324637.1 hypothetical protein [Nocardioidaceae bacterium]